MSVPSSPLGPIDTATLTPLVRQALGSETVEVKGWDTEQIYGGAGYGSAGGSAIHRVSGHGSDQGKKVEWSLVLKVLYPPADRGQPSDWDYWRREADAYQSGLLDDLPGGLAAPRCFGIVDRPDGGCWIWMEDVKDDIGLKWPLEHYGVVARHLGQLGGAYLTELPIPSCPWLSRRWIRDEIARNAPAMAQLISSREHPLVRRVFSPVAADRLLRWWTQREKLLDALDRLPQTLCHFDAFRRNLFARRTRDGAWQTVAIDWAGAGTGPIGWDIRILIESTLVWEDVDPAEVEELDRVVLEGYLAGLRDAGWAGDPRLVRFGQVATMYEARLLHLCRRSLGRVDEQPPAPLV
jgi:hypothetical protein